MTSEQSTWSVANNWLIALDKTLSSAWPSELPPESDPGFWKLAAKLEMQHRSLISRKIEQMIAAARKPSSMTALELWFYRRRVEWAAQLFLAAVQRGIEPPGSACLPEVLKWALIDSWTTDGCIGFWNHAIERGGKSHPENPDGLTPI